MSTPKFAKEEAESILTKLDHVASSIQANYEKWGMTFPAAKEMANQLDKVADDIERVAFGDESFARRQDELVTASVKKTAEVIQRDADEKYMDTFKNPQAPIQIEADEPYMKEYAVDQSSEVNHGKSTTGRPLAP